MTRIDFYVLNDSEADNRYLYACRLAQKAVKNGHRVFLHTESEQQTQLLDDLLWSFSAASFVPHTHQHNECANNPIYVTHLNDPADMHDMLINLNNNVPDCFSRFERIAELINQDETIRLAGRDRFKFYKSRGCPLKTHKL